MRVIDVFYAVALAVLLGWLVLDGVIAVEFRGGSVARENAAASLPAVSASTWKPLPVATAKVDERSFRIFVAGSPDVWSVAVSEDD